LINQDEDGEYELFYSNSTHKELPVQKQADGLYLIDSTGDGSWDHTYNPATSDFLVYHPSTPGFEIILIFCGIIIAILILRKKQLQ
jgi:hypothetical protein